MSVDQPIRTRAAAASRRPRAGLVLGTRYELTERIAVGGMGEVWRATDRRLGREVAAKVLRPELVGDELFLARLRTEARNTAGLQHRNLAMLLDHGEGDGSGYLVMELVLGETLAERLRRRGSLPARELVPILVQACHGLHAAHTAGVVHRDVKPANVMITADGTVKLTDFGISLAANQAAMTSAGMVMGTAHYLPPEQATGRPATPAGDVYALGVLAYECLTGERPFGGDSQVDVAFAHVTRPVPALPRSVPSPVAAVVRRMLTKDPAGRPASALVCAGELEDALRSLVPSPVATQPDPPRPERPAPAAQPVAPPARTAPPVVAQPAEGTGGRHREERRRAGGVVDHLPLPRPSRWRPTTQAGRPSPGQRPPAHGVPAGSHRAGSSRPRAHRVPRRPSSPAWLPTWRELSEDRFWLGAMTVILAILLVLSALLITGIGSLGDADRADADAPPSSSSEIPSTVRTSSG